jgi:hypothetical protein
MGCGMKLTTHLKLVLRSRKCGSIHPLSHTPSWHSAYLVKHRDNFTFKVSLAVVMDTKLNTILNGDYLTLKLMT